MMCYKDKAYCASDVKVHTCGREFTEQDAKDAEKWWGDKNYPVAWGYFCEVKKMTKAEAGRKGAFTKYDNEN